MIKHLSLLILACSTFCFSSTVSSLVLSTVNGEPVYESDITADQSADSRDQKIKRAIQYKLIVQEAKKRGLERTPEIQGELNKLLFKKFIADEKIIRKKTFAPTESELLSYYGKFPLIRLHHLVLNKKTETDKQVTTLALEQIKKEITKGTPFEQLCSQYSQDASSFFGGDTDFKGIHNFPESLYSKIRALPKNSVSEPIEIGNTVHLFEWFDKKPFTAAPASYLQFLQGKLVQEREAQLLKELVADLELKAIIEPKSLSVKSR